MRLRKEKIKTKKERKKKKLIVGSFNFFLQQNAKR